MLRQDYTYSVSISEARWLPAGKWIRDSGIPCHNLMCISIQEPQVPVCAPLVPPPSPDVGQNAAEIEKFKEVPHIYLYIYL